MTGLTAEKHDAFIDLNVQMSGEVRVLEKFSGSQLWQSEPDASSFPSGGMRSTFEARGYTAWDPSVPMFLVESANGRTLCIPSAYISYHGDSLDQKTPLLRSIEALSRQAVAFLKLLGDVDVKHVSGDAGRRAGVLPGRPRALRAAPGPDADREARCSGPARPGTSSSRTTTSARSRRG